MSYVYWGLWIATTVLNGILAGYMISHSIMFGRFFSWFIASGNVELLHRTYTVFRGQTWANQIYDIPLLLHLIIGIVWVALSFFLKRERLIAVLAGLSTVWVSILFLGSGLGAAEDSVLSGASDEATRQYFLSINIPMHSTFAVIYAASFLLMLLVPLRTSAR